MSTVTQALTTTFAAPTDCFNVPAAIWTDPASVWLQQGDAASSCFPSSFIRDRGKDGTVLYSPGICPAGWTKACSRETTFHSLTDTIVSCCPSSYDCVISNPAHNWENEFGCVSAVVSINRDDYSGMPSDATLLNSMYQMHIMIVEATVTTSPASQTATISPGSAPSTTSTPSSLTPDTDARLNNGLSTGAKAGIAVGAVVGAAIFGLLIYIAWRLRSKKPGQDHHPMGHNAPSAPCAPPYSDIPYKSNQQAYYVAPITAEMDGAVSAQPSVHELH